MKTTMKESMMLDRRYKRAQSIAHYIFAEIRDYIPYKTQRQVMDKILEIAHARGFEVITDEARAEAGLELRDDDGWTRSELLAFERLSLAKMMEPKIITIADAEAFYGRLAAGELS